MLTDAPKNAPVSTALKKICLNAIHSSPAENQDSNSLREAPIVIPRSPPGFLSWPGLLLERTERQGPRKATREPKKTRGNIEAAPQRQFRTPKLMRTERLSQSPTV